MTVKFGEYIQIELFGESHGPHIGVRLENIPAGLPIDMQKLQAFLDRRAPGRNAWSTSRKEPDRPVFLKGVCCDNSKAEGTGHYVTTGETLEAIIENTNVRPKDYENTSVIPRPAHADYPAWVKYGKIASGGGQFSARMTAALCIAGGLFLQWLEPLGIRIFAHIDGIGPVKDISLVELAQESAPKYAMTDFPVLRESAGIQMKETIAKVKADGDSIGGSIECGIFGLPAGIGSPVFGSMESRLSQVIYAIPAVKGIAFGSGFDVCQMKGSENNDAFLIDEGKVVTKTNHHGGILGGLSSGMPVVFRLAMKPTPSIALEQDSVDLRSMTNAKLTVHGRHDPCIVPRAVPCVEAAAAIAIGDMLLEEGRLSAGTSKEGTEKECIEEHRENIDRIDREMIRLLQERIDVVQKIGEYKQRRGLPVLDAKREQEKLKALSGLCDENKESYVSPVLQKIMDESKAYQQEHQYSYGLLGRKLGHSHSPKIHKALGGYEYGLFEREPEQLAEFLENPQFRGISVTMPYKRDVMPYCAEISERARQCNSVNTIVVREDGSLFGDNTDYAGFCYTIQKSGFDVAGKKTLVLGSGGVSGTACAVLKDLGADPVIVISRSGDNNYKNLERHADAEVIVNTTPLGMFPEAGRAAVNVKDFPSCKCIFDLIYNPLRTKIMLDGQRLGIPAFGGLPMLVAQAAEAVRLYTGRDVPDYEVDAACRNLEKELENLVLIGMPGCGKTTIGRRLAELTGKGFVDIDEEVTAFAGRSPQQIIEEDGREAFRDLETACLEGVLRKGIIYSQNRSANGAGPGSSRSKSAGLVVATGGGCVERDENYDLLKENSKVIFLRRPLEELPDDGRPISQTDGPEAIYQRRRGAYESWSDLQADVCGIDQTACQILSLMTELH